MNASKLTIEQHIDITQPCVAVIEHLVQHCPQLSKQKLKLALQHGAVWLTQGKKTTRVRRAKRVVNIGDRLHLYYDENILTTPVAPARLIADEVDYSVWYKPGGMFSQGSKWGDHSSICRWVETVGLPQRQTQLVHRLDRATSGLIIVAHTKSATRQLTAMFEQRQVEKHYQARVRGQVAASYINKKLQQTIDGKAASSHILSLTYNPVDNTTLLTIRLETGRKHQIRRHLAMAGFAIIGDRLYGEDTEEAGGARLADLQLTSCYLSFTCPLSGDNKCYQLPEQGTE